MNPLTTKALITAIENEIKRIEILISMSRESLNTHAIASFQRAIKGLEDARADLQRKSVG